MITRYSNEGIIQQRLGELGCSDNSFTKIAGVPTGTFSNYMTGKRDMPKEEAARLRAVLSKMYELQILAGKDTPIAWHKFENSERLELALIMARLNAIEIEEGRKPKYELNVPTVQNVDQV